MITTKCKKFKGEIENYLRMILRISKCCKLLPPTNIMIQDSVLGTVITVQDCLTIGKSLKYFRY